MTAEEIKTKRPNEALHIGSVMLSLFSREQIYALIDAKEYDVKAPFTSQLEQREFDRCIATIKECYTID